MDLTNELASFGDELDVPQRHIVYIQGLERVITQRNERIAQLELQLDRYELPDNIKRLTDKAFKDGVESVRNSFASADRRLFNLLQEMRNDMVDKDLQ